jgi:hypothetical protein
VHDFCPRHLRRRGLLLKRSVDFRVNGAPERQVVAMLSNGISEDPLRFGDITGQLRILIRLVPVLVQRRTGVCNRSLYPNWVRLPAAEANEEIDVNHPSVALDTQFRRLPGHAILP